MSIRHRAKRICINNRVACSALLFCVIVTTAMVLAGSIAPQHIPEGKIIAIKRDMGLSETADVLAQQGIIRSAFMYKVYVVLLSGHSKIKAGEYLFNTPQSVIKVVERTLSGAQGLPKLKVTIPEGKNVREIAWLLLKAIPRFNAPAFVALGQPYEGYLFPDTYFFYPNVTASEVVATMREEFDTKIQTIQKDITAFGKPLKDIIAMASIVEKEATSTFDRKIVAGVLWHRMDHHAALQVDPPFYYILGKYSPDITYDDLKIDSPYNLYKHVGLPPTPIGSPGIETILSTVTPTITDYWFYLSGPDGRMHYAVTYDGHLVNKAKYIK